MKISFVYTGEEYLGVEYLSAVLKAAGHQTELLYDPRLFNDYYVRNRLLSRCFERQRSIIRHIRDAQPDLIAFSITSLDCPWAYDLARRVKHKHKIPIVFGGHHPTCLPESVIREDAVDYVIQGEGEYPLLELTEYLEGKRQVGRIENLYYKQGKRVLHNDLRPLVSDLDMFPFPDKQLFYSVIPYVAETYTAMTSRGCPFECSYCHNSYLHKLYQDKGAMVRRRSVENVMAELMSARRQYPCNQIMFQDEVFTLDIEWLRLFAKAYKRDIGLPYACYVHPHTVNEEVVQLLKTSGCRTVNMGIESIDEPVRRSLMNREISQEQLSRGLALFQRYEIHCRGFFVIGYPSQTEEDMRRLASFCNTKRFGTPMVFWIQYFPKTKLAEIHHNSPMDESSLSGGYALGTHKEQRRLQQLRFLISMSPLFSPQTVDMIIRRRLYRFFPVYNLVLYLTVIKAVVAGLKRLFAKKEISRIPRLAFIPIEEKYLYFLVKQSAGIKKGGHF